MQGVCLFNRTYIIYMNNVMIVQGKICSYLNFFFSFGSGFGIFGSVLPKVKKKKNTDIALAGLKAGPLHRMTQRHPT